jgi:hypothetical protein
VNWLLASAAALHLGFSAVVPCDAVPGTTVASVHVIGGNGNPLALSLSAGDAVDFAVSGSDIVVGDLGIAEGHCGLTRTVTITAAQN